MKYFKPGATPGVNARVEDLASKTKDLLGSKFSVLSRNVSQNVQKMSDRIGDMNRDIKDKVATKVTSGLAVRPESRTTTISNVRDRVEAIYIRLVYQ